MTMVMAVLLLLLAGLLIYVFASGPKFPAETDEIIENVLGSDLPEVVAGQTGYASSGGLKIWYESLSPQVLPKGIILLITALGGHALEWSPRILQRFVNAGYQVVRYDQRGTGMSDWIEDWDFKHPY